VLGAFKNFKTVNDRNGLAFYPDWPTPTFYDQLVAATQGLMTGSLTPDAMLTQLGGQYDSGVKSITK
jgi:raffinose/stachyose/melibiose transport system substrate-binding protein